MEFLEAHAFSVFCFLVIIFVVIVIIDRMRFRTKSVSRTATVKDCKGISGKYFPVFEFEYAGQIITLDGHIATKEPLTVGSSEPIYFLPNRASGVMRHCDVRIKLWEVIAITLCALCIIFDILKTAGVF